MGEERQSWNEPAFVAVLLATLVAAVAAGWLAAAGLHVHQSYDAAQLALTTIVRETVALLTLSFCAKRYLKISLRDLWARRGGWGQVALGVAVGLGVTLLAWVVIGLLHVGDRGYVARATAAGTLGWRIALLAVVGVYSPVVQELLFRGLLLQGLLQRMNAVAAVGVSSALFALVHASSGAATIIDTFVFGIVVGVLFVGSRSLTAPVAAHVAGNSGAMLYLMWALQRAATHGAPLHSLR